MQTQIRLLIEEQSDQGLHCLLFHLHLFDKICLSLASLFEFLEDNSEASWRPKSSELYSSKVVSLYCPGGSIEHGRSCNL